MTQLNQGNKNTFLISDSLILWSTFFSICVCIYKKCHIKKSNRTYGMETLLETKNN